MRYKSYSYINCPSQQKVPRKVLEKVFITKKCTRCKTSHTLKTDIFELSDNKDIGKLFGKYASSSSNPSLTLIRQYLTSRASLPPSPPLPNFTLAN